METRIGLMIRKDLVIVGGGPAGMAAAISAHKNGAREILLLERDQYLGGILNQCVHTGFGINYFKEILTGPEYADRFIKKIKDISDIEVSLKSIVVRLTEDKSITFLKPGQLETIKAKAIIMATGCREKTREIISKSYPSYNVNEFGPPWWLDRWQSRGRCLNWCAGVGGRQFLHSLG